LESFILIAQMVLSVALVLAVLLQVRGGGLGGIFGQPDAVYRTRRGAEKVLFQMTIVLVLLLVVVSFLVLVIG
jgi:preprotein translocase subunit SecG